MINILIKKNAQDISQDGSQTNDAADDAPNKRKRTWWRYFLAGGVAGTISRTCTAPLDRLNVFMQVNEKNHAKTRMTSTLRLLIKEGGLRSLWRGNGVNVLKVSPELAIKFMAYENARNIISQHTDKDNIYKKFAAGSLAGAISQTAIYPLDVVKTRWTLGKTGQYNGIRDAVGRIYKQEGCRAFYKGYLPNLVGILPYAGIELAVYESLKTWHEVKHAEVKKTNPLILLAYAMAASTCGQMVSYPLALLRTKLQVQVCANCSIMHTSRQIYRQEGVKGFYRGVTPNFVKVAPSMSISYAVFEWSKEIFGIKK